MKPLLITLICLIYCSISFGQAFEGEIIYQNSYKSKLPNVTDAQFTTMLGTIQNYYIKGGDYKNEMNGTLVLWQIYINADNKLYNKLSNSAAILWNDGAINGDTILTTELHKNAAVILGYDCDELVLNCKSGVQQYYFSSKLGVDSKLFAKHLYGNWFAYLSQANAIPLKTVIDNPQFHFESLATAVKPMPLDQALFMLPPGVSLEKNPY
jgi:hypothetical protein